MPRRRTALQDDLHVLGVARPHAALAREGQRHRRPGADGALEAAVPLLLRQSDEFLALYHQPSNLGSTVAMIKAKFGDALRSKTDAAQFNEALCKVLCHIMGCSIPHELLVHHRDTDADARFGVVIKYDAALHEASYCQSPDPEPAQPTRSQRYANR